MDDQGRAGSIARSPPVPLGQPVASPEACTRAQGWPFACPRGGSLSITRKVRTILARSCFFSPRLPRHARASLPHPLAIGSASVIVQRPCHPSPGSSSPPPPRAGAGCALENSCSSQRAGFTPPGPCGAIPSHRRGRTGELVGPSALCGGAPWPRTERNWGRGVVAKSKPPNRMASIIRRLLRSAGLRSPPRNARPPPLGGRARIERHA